MKTVVKTGKKLVCGTDTPGMWHKKRAPRGYGVGHGDETDNGENEEFNIRVLRRARAKKGGKGVPSTVDVILAAACNLDMYRWTKSNNF